MEDIEKGDLKMTPILHTLQGYGSANYYVTVPTFVPGL